MLDYYTFGLFYGKEFNIDTKEALVRSEQFYSTVADPGEGPTPNPRGAEKNFF